MQVLVLPAVASLDPIGNPPSPNVHGDLSQSPLGTRPFKFLASSLPIADRDVLAGLSDNDVRKWSAAKADDYRRFALTLLSIYNSVAPIHRLPFEVLSTIFRMCWRNRKSFRIGHVCRQWRSVLLDTSGFWACAVKGEQFREGDCTTGYLEAVLERSMPQVIAPSFQNFSDHMSPFLALHADRITSLTVSLGMYTKHVQLWSCLNAGMHSLGILTISLLNDYRWMAAPRTPDENLRLSPISLPRLIRITAPGRFLQYFAIPSLRHVALQNAEEHIYNHRLHSDEHFQNALVVCAQNLETLSLLNVAPPRGFKDAPLSLPTLRKLIIEDKARSCALMLSRLVLSDPTAHIHVYVNDGASLSDALPLNASVVQAALSATDSVGIVSASNTIAIHCSASETETELLSVTLQAAETRSGPDLTPDDIVRFFGRKSGVPVTTLTVGPLDSQSIQAVDLSAFPHLRRIHGNGPETGFHILEELEATVDSDEEGIPAHAICPGLASLTLESEFDLDSDEECEEDSEAGTDGVDSEEQVPRMESHLADIEDYFGELCAEAERVLSQRAKRGEKLPEVKLECRKAWRPGSSNEPLWTAHVRDSELGGVIVEPVERLGD